MDEFDVVLRAARPDVDAVDGATLARLRASVVAAAGGRWSSDAALHPDLAVADGAVAGSTASAAVPAAVEQGDDTVVELVGAAATGALTMSRRRIVALAAAAVVLLAGLTAVTLGRRSAPTGIAPDDGWTAPTADHLAPSSRYRVTKLTDGSREVSFGVSLDIGLLDPLPGAGVGCRLVLLPPGIGSAAVVVDGTRVASIVPCNVADPALIAFLDALGADHPTVEVRGDELRVRAGSRELDAVRPTTVDPTTLAWTTPSLEQLLSSTYAMRDPTRLVQGRLGPDTSVDLTFDSAGFTVAVPGCGIATATATITDGHLAVSAFTAGTNSMGYTPVFGSGTCAVSDLVSAIAKARPTIEVRADQLRLQGDGVDLQGTKTAGVNASAIEVWQVPAIEQLVGHEYKVSAINDDGTYREMTAYVNFTAGVVHIGACPEFWSASNLSIVDGRLVVDALRPDPVTLLVDCESTSTEHLHTLVSLVGAKPTIEVSGGLLRLTAGTSSVIAVQPGAVDPGGDPVVTPTTAPSGVGSTTVPPTSTTVPPTSTPAPPLPHTPSIDELLGNVYVIDQFVANSVDMTVDMTVDGSPSLRFRRDDVGVRLSAGSCNRVSGYVEIAGGTMAGATVDLGDGSPPAPLWEMTDAGCDAGRAVFDRKLLDFLPSGPTVVLDGDRLTLQAGTSTVVAHRQPSAALVGTAWTYQGAFTVTPHGTVFQARQVGSTFQTTLTLAVDGTYAVTSTCLVSGTYTVAGSVLTLTPTGLASAGGCQGPTGDEGARAAAVLSQRVTLTIAERTLTLVATDGTGLTFVAG